MCRATEAILLAAKQRFADYGPVKTTMAEIAADCRMSVGNLYRHFKNKDAIIAACMEQHLQTKLDMGMRAAEKQSEPLDALRAFLQTRLHYNHQQFAGTRHLREMITLGEERHRDTLLRFECNIIAAIAALLRQGVERCCFSCADPQQTAYDIHQATMRYNHPVILCQHPLDELSADLDRLIDLLYRGFRA